MNTARKSPTTLRPSRGVKPRKRASALRSKPERSEQYKAFVRSFSCAVCYPNALRSQLHGSITFFHATSDAAHTGSHGIGKKASDLTCIPLCRKHHRELDHELGRAFWKKYGLDRQKIIATLRAAYTEEQAA